MGRLGQRLELSHESRQVLEDDRELFLLSGPRDQGKVSWTFSSRCLLVARTAHRLRDDLALEDPHSLALVLRLEQRIEALERELRAFRAR
jgi:hypothetical protein